MKVSTLVTVLAVAVGPVLCKKKPPHLPSRIVSPTSTRTSTITSGIATTTTTIIVPNRGWTPQQTSAFDDAFHSWSESKFDSPEATSFLADMKQFEVTVPYQSMVQIYSLLAQTSTDSAALAQLSSGIAKLPPVAKSIAKAYISESEAFAYSLSKSVEAMTTSASQKMTGNTATSSASVAGREPHKTSEREVHPTITLAPQISAMAGEKRHLFSSDWSPSQDSAIEAALATLSKSLYSKYPSVVTRLSTESINTKAAESIHVQMKLGATDLNAQVSSLVNLYPTYAQQYKSEKMAGVLSILSSVMDPAVTPRAIASHSPSTTIVGVFTNPSMTPEQSSALDVKVFDYETSVRNSPQYISLANHLNIEHLDSTAIDMYVTESASDSSEFASQASKILDLYPSYARSFFSSVAYAEMSIWSDIMNAPTGVPVSTAATSTSGSTLTTAAATSSTQRATSSAPSKKGGKGHPKKQKEHSTITSRAVLPRETMEIYYPVEKYWNAKQSSAMHKGASLILSSLMAHPKDWSQVRNAMTAPGWSEVQSNLAAIKPNTDIKDFKGALGHMPRSASKMVSKLIVQELSLHSKVDKMVPRTTLQTKTKSKRQNIESDSYDWATGDVSTSSSTATSDLMSLQSSSLYYAEVGYDASVMAQPAYSSITSEMDPMGQDWDVLFWIYDVGPILPTVWADEYLNGASSHDQASSDFHNMVSTMSPDVAAFFSSVASDQASIESGVSAAFATNTSLPGQKHAAGTSATVTPTGKKNSASGTEVLGSGFLAIGFIVIMLLL